MAAKRLTLKDVETREQLDEWYEQEETPLAVERDKLGGDPATADKRRALRDQIVDLQAQRSEWLNAHRGDDSGPSQRIG
jgi:hypothetical protein